ncbi:MAG: molecular chaperone DnaJ [Rhodobacter sp. CACIA14H1]|nr:MAG: molecular chaperone DnaJ [Rhodobacter sp. CACIA14H1]
MPPMSWLSRLAERQMQKARLRGELQGLEGEGKPLPDRPGDAFVSAGDAVGFRIMAEAGVLPEEIVLKKEAARLRDMLAGEPDADRRKAVMAELAQVEMRQAMAEEARRKFLRD